MTAKRQDQELVRMAEEAGFQILDRERVYWNGWDCTEEVQKLAALIRAQVVSRCLEIVESQRAYDDAVGLTYNDAWGLCFAKDVVCSPKCENEMRNARQVEANKV